MHVSHASPYQSNHIIYVLKLWYMSIYPLKLLYVCVHKLRFICTRVHSIWSLLQFFFFFLMNEFAEETLKLLFISFTFIYTLFKTHIRFSLRVTIKREILIYFWNLKMNRKAYKLCRIISVLLSSFIICMYSKYVGIGILVTLEMLQYWIVPTNRRKCWQAFIIVYFQCNVLSDIHFAQTSGQTRTKWRQW